MTAGYRADGRTAPSWRSCEHPLVIVGRCFHCRAIAIEGFVQPSNGHSAVGAVGIGSMTPIINKAKDLSGLKGDGTSRDRFNYPINGGKSE